jgi:hypothetical protein
MTYRPEDFIPLAEALVVAGISRSQFYALAACGSAALEKRQIAIAGYGKRKWTGCIAQSASAVGSYRTADWPTVNLGEHAHPRRHAARAPS